MYNGDVIVTFTVNLLLIMKGFNTETVIIGLFVCDQTINTNINTS